MTNRVICVCKDGHEIGRYSVGNVPILLGRSFDADIVLLDESVSRKQATIRSVQGALMLEDHESRNGTLLNGQPVKSASLSEGDVVSMGSYSIRVERAAPQTQILSLARDEIPESGGLDASEGESVPPGDPILMMYRMAQLLRRRFQLEESLPKILSLVMEAAGVKRGFILTYNPESGEPQVQVSLMAHSAEEAAPVSITLADYVRATKNAVFTRDAANDPRFRKSESIHRHGIGAAMVLPLYGTDDVMGVIQLDSETIPSVFSTDQLQLLSALGRMVGAAIEDAQLAAEHERQQELAAIGNAIAEIGHDMNNIMLGIKGGMEILHLGQDAKNHDRIDSGMHILEGSVQRFEQVIGDLLTFVRRTDLHLEPVSIKGLLEDVIRVVEPHALKCRVTIDFSGEELRAEKADGQLLHRVFVNLLHNAIDAYEGNGGKVEIALVQNPAGTTVTVRDSGVGIAAADVARIFQPFFTTKRGRGTGLGLPFCHRVIKQHGGRISVDSTRGKGSTFSVFLPGETARIPVAAKTQIAQSDAMRSSELETG